MIYSKPSWFARNFAETIQDITSLYEDKKYITKRKTLGEVNKELKKLYNLKSEIWSLERKGFDSIDQFQHDNFMRLSNDKVKEFEAAVKKICNAFDSSDNYKANNSFNHDEYMKRKGYNLHHYDTSKGHFCYYNRDTNDKSSITKFNKEAKDYKMSFVNPTTIDKTIEGNEFKIPLRPRRLPTKVSNKSVFVRKSPTNIPNIEPPLHKTKPKALKTILKVGQRLPIKWSTTILAFGVVTQVRNSQNNFNNDQKELLKTNGCIMPRHMLGAGPTRYPDIVTSKGVKLGPITNILFVSPHNEKGSVRVFLSGGIIMQPDKKNGLLSSVGLPSFYYNGNLKSGTPIYNSNGDMCSIITASDGSGNYAVSGKTELPLYTCDFIVRKYHGDLLVSDDYKLINGPNGTFYVKIGNKELGLYDGAPMHCIDSAKLPMYKRTHHHYIDYFARELAGAVTDDLYLGRPDGPKVHLTGEQVMGYGYDTRQLFIGALPVFKYGGDLTSGTPIYNNKGFVCSWVTSSVGDLYVVTKFGDNVTLAVSKATIIKNSDPKLITYGSHTFDDKKSLLSYISSPKQDGSKVVIWTFPNGNKNFSVEVNGFETFKMRTTLKIVEKFHTTKTKKDITRSIEIGHVAGEIAYLAERFANLKTHTTNANKLDSQLQNMTTVKKRKVRKSKAKTILQTVGITLLMLMLSASTVIAAPPDADDTPTKGPGSKVCKFFMSRDLNTVELNSIKNHLHCGGDLENRVKTIESYNKDVLDKISYKEKCITYRLCKVRDNTIKRISAECGANCNGILNIGDYKTPTNLSESNLLSRISHLSEANVHLMLESYMSDSMTALGNLQNCKKHLLHFKEMIPKVNIENLTEAHCAKELAELDDLEESITHFRFDSIAHGMVGTTSTKCNATNWDHNRFLTNGAGGSCQTGISTDVEGKGECKEYETAVCHSAIHDKCVLGHQGVIEEDGIIYSKSAITTKQKCCTLDCFSQADLYMALTDQPLCSTCVKPFIGLLWHSDCNVKMGLEVKPLEDLKIYSYHTVFNVDGSEFECRNIYNFEKCCGGNGPSNSKDNTDFIDKFCACTMSKKTILTKYIAMISNVITNQYNMLGPLLTLLFVCSFMLFPKVVVVLLLTSLFFRVTVASCEIDDLVPLPSNAKNYEGDVSIPIRVRLTKGDCVDAGDTTVEITGIERESTYKFLSSMPYKIKTVCSEFTWGCQLGKASTIEHSKDECERRCTNGMLYRHTAIQSYFEGAACMILSGIHTKMTACFSAGSMGSEVKIFTRLGLDTKLKLHSIRHRHGINLATDMKMDSDDNVQASSPSSDDTIWPLMVAVRGGDRFCAYSLVDITHTCHSSNIHDPLDIDINCLQAVPHWNVDSKSYELKYKNNDFEDMVHAYFERCDSSLKINHKGYNLKVSSMSNAVVLTLQFKKTGKKMGIALCDKLPDLQIEKGITGYHQATVLTIKSNESKKCIVYVTIEGCESTQGQLFVLRPKVPVLTDYWCANNSTGEVRVEIGSGVNKVVKDVAKNVLPHKQQVENYVASLVDNGVSAVSMTSVYEAIGDFNVWGKLVKLGDMFSFNMYKWALILFSSLLIYRGVVQFEVSAVLIGLFLMFIAMATPILGCSSFLNYFRPPRLSISFSSVDKIENLTVAITTKAIEISHSAMVFVAPRNQLVLVRAANRLAGLLLITVTNLSLSLLSTILCYFIFRLTMRLLNTLNINKPSQDVVITIPGMPIVCTAIYRRYKNYSNYYFYLNPCKVSTTQIIRDITAPIYCSNGHLQFKLSELVEGNNKLDGGCVYRKGDYFYTAAHCLTDSEKSKYRITHEVVTNDQTVIVAATDTKLINVDLDVGDSGTVVVQNGGHYMFIKKVNAERYGRLLMFKSMANQTTEIITKAKCIDCSGECYEKSCPVFLEKKNKLIPRKTCGGDMYEDPFKRQYKVILRDSKIGLVHMDIQANHVECAGLLHKDGLDLRYTHSVNFYKGDISRWCVYAFEHHTNSWFRVLGDYEWVISPDFKCIAKCFTFSSNKTIISGSLLYIKKYWGLGSDKYIVTGVVVGKVGDKYVASTPGQDYMYLPDNNTSTTITQINDRYRHIEIKNHENVIHLSTKALVNLTYSMTDAGYSDDLSHYIIENADYITVLGNEFAVSQLQRLGAELFEVFVQFMRDNKDYKLASLKRVISAVSDDATVRKLAAPASTIGENDIEALRENVTTASKSKNQYIQEDLVNYEHNYTVDCNSLSAQSYRPILAVRLERSGTYRTSIERGNLIIRFSNTCELEKAITLIHELVVMGYSAVQLYIPPDDLVINNLSTLVKVPYSHAYDTVLLYISPSDKISSLISGYIGDVTYVHSWADLKRAHPTRMRSVEQYYRTNASNVTLASLRNWNSVHFASSAEETTPSITSKQISDWEAFNPVGDRTYICQVQSGVSVGTAFGRDGGLMSNYHVTYGCDVKWSVGELTHVWKNPNLVNSETDIICYNTKEGFANITVGEICVAVNPFLNWAQFFICIGIGADMSTRSFRAVSIDDIGFDYVLFDGMPGASGTPIYNSDSELVGIYGSGRYDFKEVPTLNGALKPMQGLTQISGVSLKNIDMRNHFSNCAKQVIEGKICENEHYYLLAEPTGSGKTTLFTIELAVKLKKSGSILLLQPNVAAVKNSYTRIASMIKNESIGNVSVQYSVGVVNETHEDRFPDIGERPNKIIIKTYGKNCWDLKNMSSYEFVLLDEIHVITDPDVVLTDAYTTAAIDKRKIVKMTATPTTYSNAKVLGEGDCIATNRFAIDISKKLIRAKGKETMTTTNYVITPKDIGCISDAYWVPKDSTSVGVVVFMCASIRDTERGVTWARKVGYPGPVFPIHAGTIRDLNSLPSECWLFATDVIAQSVTIPNLTTMIDFCKEYKPTVRLERTEDGIEYEKKLMLRDISTNTRDQRKGRLGRTQPGTYIVPENAVIVSNPILEPSIFPEIVLKMAEIDLGVPAITCEFTSDIVSAINKHIWIHPTNLKDDRVYQRLVLKVAGRQKVSFDMREKLRVVSQINGDMVWWYLTPIISKELKLANARDPKRQKMDQRYKDDIFYRDVAKFIVEVDTESSRYVKLAPSNIYSFQEMPDTDDLSEMLAIVESSSDGEIIEDSKMILIGVPVIGMVVASMAACTTLMNKNCSRYVTEVASIEKGSEAGVGKRIASELNSDVTAGVNRNNWKVLLHQIKNWMHSNLAKIKVMLGLTRVKDNALEANISLLLAKLQNFTGPIISSLGGFTVIGSILGAAGLGAFYRSLESILGSTITNLLLSAITAYVGLYHGASSIFRLSFSVLIGFIINGIHRMNSNSHNPLLQEGSSSRAAARLLSAIAVGGLVSTQMTGAAPSIMAAASSGSVDFSNKSVVVAAKQLYLIFANHEQLSRGDMTVTALDLMVNLITFNPIQAGLICGIISALVAVRTIYNRYLAKYATEVRPHQSTDNPSVEMFRRLDIFDSVVLNLLSAASVVVNPISIISIVVHYAGSMMKGEETDWRKSFEIGAGTNPLLMIAVKVFEVINKTARREDSLMPAAYIASIVSGVCGTIYYTTQRDSQVKQMISTVICTIIHYIKMAIEKIGNCIKSGIMGIGKMLGVGAAEGVRNAVPGGKILIKGALNPINRITERPPVRGRSEEVNLSLLNLWKLDSGITELEMVIVSSGAGVYQNSGNLNSIFIGDTLPTSVSTIKKMTINRPFSFMQVPTNSIQVMTSKLLGISSMENDVMVIPLSHGTALFQNNFNNETALCGLQLKLNALGLSFTAKILIKIVKEGQGCTGIMLAENVPSELVSKVLEIMGRLHAVFKNVESVSDISLDEAKMALSPTMTLDRTVKQGSVTTMIFSLLSGLVALDADKFSNKILKRPDIDKKLWACKKYKIIKSLYGRAIDFELGQDPAYNMPEDNFVETIQLNTDELNSIQGESRDLPLSLKMCGERDDGVEAKALYCESLPEYIDQIKNLAYRSNIILFIVWNDVTTDMVLAATTCRCCLVLDLRLELPKLELRLCQGENCTKPEFSTNSDTKVPTNIRFDSDQLTTYYRYYSKITGKDSNVRDKENNTLLGSIIEKIDDRNGVKDCMSIWQRLFGSWKREENIMLLEDGEMPEAPDSKAKVREKLLAILENVNYTIVKADSSDCHVEEKLDEPNENSVDNNTFIGFRNALTKPTSNAKLTPMSSINKMYDYPNEREVLDLWNRLNSRGSKFPLSTWEEIQCCKRTKLPKRQLTLEDVTYTSVSRGGYKMQQLVEAVPTFFDDCTEILDVCCGYGGFEDYMSHRYKDKAPRNIYVSTLEEKGHRPLNVTNIGESGSAVKIIDIGPDSEGDKGNIKNLQTIRNHVSKLKTLTERIDLLIFDVGEFKHTGESQKKMWKESLPNGVSLLEAMRYYMTLLRPGGKCLLKFTGYFPGGLEIFNELTNKFKKILIHKVGTSSLFSTEFYVYLEGYSQDKTTSIEYVREVWRNIGNLIMENLLVASQVLRARGLGYHTNYRNDWYSTQGQGVTYRALSESQMTAGGTYKYHVQGKETTTEWSCNYNNKIKLFEKEISANNNKRITVKPVTKNNFDNLVMVGSIPRKQQSHGEKDQYNGLISSAVYNIYGVNKENSTFGQTQYSDKFKQQAIKKRLDTKPISTPPEVLVELHNILELMLTAKGRSKLNSFDFASKEEVELYVNNQGATGIFDRGHNLKQFMELHPNWYDLAMKLRVAKWRNGEACASYMSVRYKPESKMKKNSSEGTINHGKGVSREQLKEESNLIPRFITFGDALTRLGHYIVIGKFLAEAGQNKMYKGSINGLPPNKVGIFLRGVYDLHKHNTDRVLTAGNPSNNTVTFERNNSHDSDVRANCGSLDYSNWDATVTVEERMLEAKHVMSFFLEHRKTTVFNMLKDMCFSVCVNDEGDVWLRSGQRGSGELMTSYGNTLLVQANTIRAIAKSTGRTPEDILDTKNTINVKLHENKYKTYEITAIPTYSDGDDTVIITSNKNMERIKNHIDEILSEAGKTIRSGQKSGITTSTDFSDLEFCSHRYEPVLIGRDASNLSMTKERIEKGELGYDLQYLPTKYASDIISKSRLTLKVNTKNWNPNDNSPNGCVQITRGKIISYSLLYPHIRAVRMLMIALLMVVGDGPTDMTRFKKRYSDINIDRETTLSDAMYKVYGVRQFTDIGYQQYKLHTLDMIKIRHNVSLTSDYCHLQIKSVASNIFNWVFENNPRSLISLKLDKKMLGYFQKWIEIAIERDNRITANNMSEIRELRDIRIEWINSINL